MLKRLVILTGAGISAESGLKTFRDSDGLWEGHDPQDVATPEAYARDPRLVLDFYNHRRRQVAAAEPNQAHRILAELEAHFDVHIITQNVDDLHERAGSSHVLHLHGEIFRMRSSADSSLSYGIREDISLGQLAEDGSQLRPDIVWFGEPVPMIGPAMELTGSADLFAVVGTSLMVYPAAGLVGMTQKGTPLFVVDKKLPDLPVTAEVTLIQKPATEGMAELKEILLSRYT